MEIPLGGKNGEGSVAYVDPEFHGELSQYKWHFSGGYAKSKLGFMHRVVMKLEDPDLVVDHLNGNRLDNRRINLRVKTQKGNAKNKTNDPVERGYTGVRKSENGDYYETVHKNCILYSNKMIEMCALCYDSVVTYCYGPGKRVNDIKLEPMNIAYWELSESVMNQLDQWKSKHTDFIGVKKSKNGWKAKIVVDLGEFKTPEEAAIAYNRALKTVKPNAKAHEYNKI